MINTIIILRRRLTAAAAGSAAAASLAALRPGSRVNLERAMAANGRFGGHIVAGHVDGLGTVRRIEKDDNAIWFTIAAGPEILRYVVEKGSITIDGISLTVAAVTDRDFSVSIIPHTGGHTALLDRPKGYACNLETDVIGKYIQKFLAKNTESTPKKSTLTMDFLRENGF